MKQDKLSRNPKVNFDKVVIDIEDNGNYFFEIKSNMTNDISEAVAIMMTDDCFENHDIWNTTIPDYVTEYDICTEKTIYWLTGGNSSWSNKKGIYNTKWIEVANEYDYILSTEIQEIFVKSKTFGELRNNYKKSFPLIRMLDLAVFLNILN